MIVVIGLGSIGKRHVKNLIKLNVDVAVISGGQVTLEFTDIPIFKDINNLLNSNINITAIIICTPTHLHLDGLLFCINHNIPCLIEKPISHNYDNVEYAFNLSQIKKSKIMVGFNFRYHIQLIKIKEILINNLFGKVRYANFWWCDDITLWYPDKKYLGNYSTNVSMGGGALLTICHEIDLALWLLGKPLNLNGSCKKLSNEKYGDAEDFFSGNISFENNIYCNITLDFISNIPRRGLFINMEHGTISWDYFEGNLLISEVGGKCTTFNLDKINADFKNSLYIDELKDFILFINDEISNPIPFKDGLKVQYLIEQFKISSDLTESIVLENKLFFE